MNQSSLSPHVVKDGCSLPPLISSAAVGEVRVRIDKLLWSLPKSEHPVRCRTTARWWGSPESPEFNISNSLQKTLATSVVFPVKVDKQNFGRYLRDCHEQDSFRIIISKDSRGREQIAEAEIDIRPLIKGRTVSGFFAARDDTGKELAKLKVKITIQYHSKQQGDPPQQQQQHLQTQHEEGKTTSDEQNEIEIPVRIPVSRSNTPPVPQTVSGSYQSIQPLQVSPAITTPSHSHRSDATVSSVVAGTSATTQPKQLSTLDSVMAKALQLQKDLAVSASKTTIDAYDDAVVETEKQLQQLNGQSSRTTIPDIPPPVYVNHILGSDSETDEYYDEDDDDFDRMIDIPLQVRPTTSFNQSYDPIKIITENSNDIVTVPTVKLSQTAPVVPQVSHTPLNRIINSTNGETNKVLVVIIHQLKLVRQRDVEAALGFKLRVLSSKCVHPLDKCLPFSSEIISVEAAQNLKYSFPIERYMSSSCVVIEVTACCLNYNLCLGVVTLSPSGWDGVQRSHIITDPLSNAPSATMDCELVVCNPPSETLSEPQPPQKSEPKPQTPPASLPITVQHPPPSPPDNCLKMRTVEIVHTYHGSEPLPEKGRVVVEPQRSDVIKQNNESSHGEQITVNVIRASDLPLLETDCGAAAPKCFVAINSSKTSVCHSCDPNWYEDIRAVVLGDVIVVQLFDCTDAISPPQLLATCKVIKRPGNQTCELIAPIGSTITNEESHGRLVIGLLDISIQCAESRRPEPRQLPRLVRGYQSSSNEVVSYSPPQIDVHSLQSIHQSLDSLNNDLNNKLNSFQFE